MYISDLKIALDDDSATYYDIKATYSLLPDLSIPFPAPKMQFLSVVGINGGADLSEVFGSVYYNNRQLVLRLTARTDGLLTPEAAVKSFAADYDGQRVRIKVLGTTDYFFRGRLAITADDEEKTLRQITCKIEADPLKYETTYTPNSTGTDLRPTAWSANMWSAANIDGNNMTATGATIPADPSKTSYAYVLKAASFPTGKLVRIYFQNLTNCTVEIQRGERTIGNGAGSHIYLSTGTPVFFIIVRPIDNTQTASFECIVRTIDTTTITTDSKAVPLQIESTYVPNVNYPVKMFLNGTIFTVKPDGDWKEYAPAMIKTGTNYIATFVDVSTFDPTAAGSGGVLNVRYRGGVL